MSLEQAITENTAALRELLATLRTFPKSAGPIDAPEPTTKKDPAPSSSAPTPTASASSAPSSSESTPADAPEVIEYKHIQQLVPKIAKELEGTEKVVALFQRYGVRRGPELKPESYADFYAELQKIEAGEFDPRLAEV